MIISFYIITNIFQYVFRNLASLLERLSPGREFTVRITGASVKNPARFGSFFTDIPAASFGGAFYSHTEGHGVFAFRVSRAGQKPAEPAFFDHHIPAAFATEYIRRDCRETVCPAPPRLVYLHGIFAFRVSRAGQKLAEPAFLGNHFLSAFFAFYRFSHILNLSGIFTIVGCYIPCILTCGVVGTG